MPEKLLKITLIDGNVLKCTPDHPILVHLDNRFAYLNASALIVRDKVVVIGEYNIYSLYLQFICVE
jgi:intein/homing endonuclease